MPEWQIITGDCRDVLAGLDSGCAQTCVTSPPYFGLRDYGHDGQVGLEATPDEFVAALVEVFGHVRRVLADDGTVWLNLGDSYAANRSYQVSDSKHTTHDFGASNATAVPPGCKPKDLLGIPWMVAFALRADGWYLRSEIIWHKPNPMPESVTDRPTKSHESIFLLSKKDRYYYDAEAIREDAVGKTAHDLTGPSRTGVPGQSDHRGSRAQTIRALELAEEHGLTDAHFAAIRACGVTDAGKAQTTQSGFGKNTPEVQALADEAKAVLGGYYREFLLHPAGRNKRDVWTIPVMPYRGVHCSTFPPNLIVPCILAGAPEGATVLDPFSGAGTTGMVALRHGRSYVGVELNPEYAEMSRRRIVDDAPLMNQPSEVAA